MVLATSGTGDPSLPFAFNLGQLMGLSGAFSLVPFGELVLLWLLAIVKLRLFSKDRGIYYARHAPL